MATAVLVRDQTSEAVASPDAAAQSQWAATPIAQRLAILRLARHDLAAKASELVAAISPELSRTRADTYAAEILPLLAACRFLERNAARILKPRRLGRRGLPFWLAGIDTVIERVPFGRILIIAPSNYPLFLGGVQTLQALAAGNAVTLKPGRGGEPVAQVFAAALARAGLPAGLLRVTEDSAEAAMRELQNRPDKIVFTGSSSAGRSVLRTAAETATPVVAELSGCDAVIVLPGADLARVADALCFGMRLNGSATCMAPRRLLLVGPASQALLPILIDRFAAVDGIALPAPTRTQLKELLADATASGATVSGNPDAPSLKPLLILDSTPHMRLAQSDIFAPVLSVLTCRDRDEALAADRRCPFGLTAAIFGEVHAARELGALLVVGTVLINDLIVPTADPRVPFGGRRGSGFGATRGAEGLLEMTSAKVIAVNRQRTVRHFEPTTEAHEAMFQGVLDATHARTLRDRLRGVQQVVAAARHLAKRFPIKPQEKP